MSILTVVGIVIASWLVGAAVWYLWGVISTIFEFIFKND